MYEWYVEIERALNDPALYWVVGSGVLLGFFIAIAAIIPKRWSRDGVENERGGTFGHDDFDDIDF